MMEQLPMLPIPVFENILSYLNTLDQHNAISAFQYNYMVLSSHLNKQISLALDSRFQRKMIDSIILRRKDFIKELDLTGIFWITQSVLLTACEQLENLENMYVLGTSIKDTPEVRTKLREYKSLQCLAMGSNGQLSLFKPDPQRGNKKKLAIQFRITTEKESGTYPIMNDQWLLEFKVGVTKDNFSTKMKLTNYSEVTYSDFIVDDNDKEEKLKTLLFNLRNENTLFLRQEASPRIANVNIEPIKNLINLTNLHLDIHGAVGHKFLKPILQSLTKLKKFAIRCYSVSFSFTHLKFASEQLKDLSVFLPNSVNFNMDKLFFDLNSNSALRLRRMSLFFNLMATDKRSSADIALREFMRKNPQLQFLWIGCKDASNKVTRITRLFKTCKVQSTQIFVCTNKERFGFELVQSRGAATDKIPEVPLQHADMMDVYLSIC